MLWGTQHQAWGRGRASEWERLPRTGGQIDTWSGVDWGPEGPNRLLECVHLSAGQGSHPGGRLAPRQAQKEGSTQLPRKHWLRGTKGLETVFVSADICRKVKSTPGGEAVLLLWGVWQTCRLPARGRRWAHEYQAGTQESLRASGGTESLSRAAA